MMRTLNELIRPDRVHREVYKEPEVFDLEMDRIFKGTWVYLAHESEVREPGDYRSVRVGREPVILVRDHAGELQALVNRCRHRGATVCQQASGNSMTFRCHYHGWTYRCNGDLTGVPRRERYDRDVRSELGLHRLPRVASYRGLVFGSFSEDVLSLEEHLGPAAISYIDRWLDHAGGRALTTAADAHEMDARCNWKLQVENGVDGYHATFTHRSFFDLMQERTGQNVRFASSFSDAQTKAFPRGTTVVDPQTSSKEPLLHRVAAAPDAERLMGELSDRVDEATYRELLESVPGAGINIGIFPNLQLIGIHIRRIEPMAVDHTVVSVRPLLLRDGPPEVNELRLRYHELFYGPAGFGQPDDVEMFRRVWDGLDDSEEPWLMLDRGHADEEGDADVRVGHVSDETPQRSQYREWQRLMEQEARA